jgi:hypothetical protein
MAKTCCDSIMRSMTTRMAIEVCWRGWVELRTFSFRVGPALACRPKKQSDARVLSARSRRLLG